MPKFAAGVVKFQQEVFPGNAGLFEKLAQGQAPEALFITCSDSRIETGGTTAAIEYACIALNVPHIVICGHTQCGAMHLEGLDGLPHVKQWLSYARSAVEITNELGKDLDERARGLMLLQQNVILQLTHLRTHPAVAVRLARGDLRLHGWVCDIVGGEVTAWDEAANSFEPVSERYAAEVAKHLALHSHT